MTLTTQSFYQDFSSSTQNERLDNFSPIHQKVQVTFNYPVHFTTGLFQTQNPLLAKTIATFQNPKQAIVVVDSGLLEQNPQLIQQIIDYAHFYKTFITLNSKPIIIPGGEVAKNDPQLLDKLHQAIDTVGLCRHSYVLAIGGGAVLDLVGYAAATAHRGVRCIRIPTTAQA
jgi:3-dehydroquinate synthase